MQCKCGKEIKNVPEFWSKLANWVCKDCSDSLSISGDSVKTHYHKKIEQFKSEFIP